MGLRPQQPGPAPPLLPVQAACSTRVLGGNTRASSQEPVLDWFRAAFIGAALRLSPRSCPHLAECPYLQESSWHGL